MTSDELKAKAIKRVQEEYPEGTGFKFSRAYENLMDGTVVSVSFKLKDKEELTHIYFDSDEKYITTYRWHGDVLAAVSGTKEHHWFFRFIQLAGIGGVIASVLILLFSGLLCALALCSPDKTSSILDVVKLSFTTILGYFFGSTAKKK